MICTIIQTAALVICGCLVGGCGPLELARKDHDRAGLATEPFATIGSSSMEPTLLGPQTVGRCEECGFDYSFSTELAIKASVLFCPHCRSLVEPQQSVAGEIVALERLAPMQALKRGDVIVFHDPFEASAKAIKRLVGFPNESIRILDGDLWIDRKRLQKEASLFLQVAIPVESWPELVAVSSSDGATTTRPTAWTCLYHSTSLWPRSETLTIPAARHPSPILDETPSNPIETNMLVQVNDIGLLLDLQRLDNQPFEFSIALWFEDALHGIACRFDGEMFTVQTDDHSGASLSLALNLENRYRIIAAMVDGRLIVAMTDSEQSILQAGSWLPSECLTTVPRNGITECTSERPIYVSGLNMRDFIRNATIIRDIHYRGPHGESDYQLPVVNAYHVLGDNISVASDARNELSEGIDRNRILAKVRSSRDLKQPESVPVQAAP